ncbi:MAG: hypothetical protein ABJZ55_08985 [Fuerstiella sp.]
MHPLSFTEAWVTISDRIEVKLGLFTDDIIRYDRGSEPLPERLSADEFQRILDRQTPELLRRIQLYAGGQRLIGEVTSVPDSWASGDVIDIVGSANVKHSWSFAFQYSGSPLRSLTIRHSFSPPGIQQPGELRLHSRHKAWKQRIDAVIPPELAYTVAYRKEGNSTAATATANETTSRMIVSPFAMTHEVTLPLATVLAAFPNVSEATETNKKDQQDILSVSHQQQLGEQLNHWIQENTIVETNGKPMTTRMVAVQFFESGIIPEQPVPDSVSSPVSVPGTLIGIRQTYARSGTSHAGSLKLKAEFPGTSEIRCETIANNAASTSLQTIEGSSNAGQTLHKWSTSIDESKTQINAQSSTDISQELTTRTTPPGRPFALTLIACGSVLAACAFAFRKFSDWLQDRQSAFQWIVAIGLILVALGITRLPATINQQEPAQIHGWMSAALKTIYQTLQASSEAQTVQNLSTWLSDELVESTYLTVCQQMAAEPEQATWTGIQDVHLTELQTEVITHNDLKITCQWEVQGMAYHWGHAHQVNRRYSGEFTLAKKATDWKIQELSQLQAMDSTPLL